MEPWSELYSCYCVDEEVLMPIFLFSSKSHIIRALLDALFVCFFPS